MLIIVKRLEMDSIGDYLYLVLMIGAVIVSLLRKNKKEVPPPPVSTSKPEHEPKDLFSEMRNWMEQDEDEVEEEIQAKEYVPVFEAPKASPFVHIQTPVFTYDSPENAKPGRATTTTAPMMVQSIDDEWESVLGDEGFDGRKAIIYSEIMKRPTW
jgi:hypothetical protein